MSINLIVRHCAPTLAGLKVANLFSFNYLSRERLTKEIEELNELLNPKGLHFIILRVLQNKALVLVYRRNKLITLLQDSNYQQLLSEYGYMDFDIDSCLKLLKAHINNTPFPHEIGLFLGYPLNDVKEFIKHQGKDCKCVGQWKVYDDEVEAKKTFEKFNKCTKIYCEKLHAGIDITRLTVVG